VSSTTTAVASARSLTADGDGEPIDLYVAYNDFEEARFVVERIQDWERHGGKRAEIAVLYRSNAQSRVFEETLVNAGIPYTVYGGLRFFERAEIKDALAYLRLIASRHDDPSFERVANVPTRGIGLKSLETLRALAKAADLSLWEAAERAIATGAFPAERRWRSRASSIWFERSRRNRELHARRTSRTGVGAQCFG
jgi:DNA helicase-2/ATP-dependent DNA helicase PcrA